MSINDLPTLTYKEELKAEQRIIIDQFKVKPKAEIFLHQLCQNVDKTLQKIWKQIDFPKDLALVAVGGYGRGELFPFSDVDVLILLPAHPDQQLKDKLEKIIQAFWDLGLDFGHSVRTIEECVTESAADITVNTCLLEARLVAGSREQYIALKEAHRQHLHPKKFFQAKLLELRQRHIKYEDTPYSLEPNCKESPGGLRDLQVILWVAKAAQLGNSWSELATRGLITLAEARQLKRNERAFKDIRVRLHLQAGRREDRLVFDLQTPIAKTFGFENTDSRRASEYLMQRYYLAAKAVFQLNTILLQNIETVLFPKPLQTKPLNERFNEVNGLIDMVDDDIFETQTSSMLEIFLLLSQHAEINGITARTLRALWHARFLMNASFRKLPENRAIFIQIIQSPRGITHTLRLMNQISILGRYLPNFRRITGQMQHDLFHVYTVDQHILMVVRNLRRFTIAEHAHEYPFCSQLMANFNQHWILYIAALFHDIAKGRNGDHSVLGMADTKKFCQDHGISKENTELAIFLVQQHLTMSQVAQKQDLSDPKVIQRFANLVKDERHLTALYLLTVADIRGTSPKVWNAWKGKLLEDLYRITIRVLGGETPNKDHELKNRKEDALKGLRLLGIQNNVHEEFWQQLDVAYFLRHDSSDIAWQTRVLYERINSTTPIVKCRLSPIGEGLQVVVYVKDQEELFARICHYFDSKNFDILDAKIHTTKADYALDTFLVTESAFAKNYRDIINLIEHELSNALTELAPLPDANKNRLSRQSRNFPVVPTVELLPDEKGQFFLLSLTANDRKGLLYSIAKVLSQYKVNLHTAKIMTLGERVEDVFLIESSALQSPRTQIQFETDLINAMRI
jgi:[protein-PII] uridylyltransferase